MEPLDPLEELFFPLIEKAEKNAIVARKLIGVLCSLIGYVVKNDAAKPQEVDEIISYFSDYAACKDKQTHQDQLSQMDKLAQALCVIQNYRADRLYGKFLSKYSGVCWNEDINAEYVFVQWQMFKKTETVKLVKALTTMAIELRQQKFGDAIGTLRVGILPMLPMALYRLENEKPESAPNLDAYNERIRRKLIEDLQNAGLYFAAKLKKGSL